MRILILGAGYLGKKFHSYFTDSILSKNRINNTEDVVREIEAHKPDVLINCIGKTGRPNIDWCEDNKVETIQSNVIVPILIEKACCKKNVKMVQIGTGCLYQGSNRFHEDDTPNFLLGTYAHSKHLSQQLLGINVLQLRVRMPIDGTRDERNLLSKLIKYDKTININNSITILPDLMVATRKLLFKDAHGVFNVVNPEPVTHKQIIDIYNLYSSSKKSFNEVSVLELDKMTKARRSNCTLSTVRLNGYGVYMPDTMESLHKCVKEYVNEESTAVL